MKLEKLSEFEMNSEKLQFVKGGAKEGDTAAGTHKEYDVDKNGKIMPKDVHHDADYTNCKDCTTYWKGKRPSDEDLGVC